VSVVDQAENVGGVVSAARMRDKFMRQRANAPDEERREALGDAIGTLHVRFPELEDLPAGGAERFARERGHGTKSRSPSHNGRQRKQPGHKRQPDAAPLEQAARKAGAPKPKAKPAGPASKPTSARPGTKPRSTSPRPAARAPRSSTRSPLERRGRALGGRLYRETGIPAAGASTTSILMSLLGGTVGLAAVYLVLTSAEKSGTAGSALPTALDSATGFLRRVIAPEDFFGPGLSGSEYAAAENPNGRAATEQKSLAAAGHPSLPVKPGIKVDGHPLLPRQLGFKK
jgi:hypothetical protein